MNFLYVKVFESYRLTDRHTYIHTDRQTRPKLYTTPLRGWSVIAIKVNDIARPRRKTREIDFFAFLH